MSDEKLPAVTEQPEEDRGWRDVAQSWKRVGKQVKELGDRLSVAFREGWTTDQIEEAEAKALGEKLRALGERLDRAVDSMREEAKQPGTKAHAKETLSSTKSASSEFFDELQTTLSDGFEEVNKKVDDLLAKRKKK